MSNHKKRALFTANKDVATSFINSMKDVSDLQLLHLELEKYAYSIHEDEQPIIIDSLPSLSFIIHGNLRNARFFIKWMKESNVLKEVRDIVHLVTNQETVDLLSEHDIPAIMPREDARPIDIIEFMLRISREGRVLYPTTDQRDEEVPGLLQELEIPVIEFQVCSEESLTPELLNEYRESVSQTDIDAVIFHSRSAVNRIQIAFPDLDLSKVECISSGQAVTQKLGESDIEPGVEAKGSWRSMVDILSQSS